jgi:NADPH-dependent curcumin reductase CurA
LGADYVIDYKKESVKDSLRDLFKNGVDVYLDNVGGEMLDDVLMNIKDESRIVLCGAISSYNNLGADSKQEGYRLKNYPRLIIKRATMKGYVVVDYAKEFPKAYQELFALIGQGKLKVKVDMSNGIDECPAALIKLLTGKNTGKVIVKVSQPQPKL